MRPCAFADCDRPLLAHGLCAGHYEQQRRGHQLQPLRWRRSSRPAGVTVAAWLLANVEYDTTGWGCWLWSRGQTGKGYGKLKYEGIDRQAHRVAYETWVGPIPADRPHICHRCDTRLCIRPDHLFAGTPQDNMADMVRKGRDQWSKYNFSG